MSALDVVLDHLPGAKPNGSGYVACCPAHDDHNPSLKVSIGEDGRVLMHCHAGCPTDRVLEAAGLKATDLFDAPATNGNGHKILATYDYTDEDGCPLFQVVRFVPKDFRQRRRVDGEWAWSLGDTRRVIYRLPAVRDAIAAGQTIYVVEGEKDVDRLTREGVVATCSPMGAGKWRPEYARMLQGAASVVVVADADEPGYAHAKTIATSLDGKVGAVRLVRPAAGKDAFDHLAAGHTLDEFIDADAPDVQAMTLTVRSVLDAIAIPPLEPEEIVRGCIRRAELLALGAPRGIGKSLAAAQLALLGGTGSGWWLGGLQVIRPVRVLIAQGELDEWGTYARWQRLLANPPATAPGSFGSFQAFETFDRWRVRVVKMRSTRRDDGGSDTSEYLDAILDPRLEATIVEHGIDVLIIDPWAVFYAGAENSNDETEAALDKLRDLAMRTGCAIFLVHHLSKALDVREPEDAWRGASRLADWASTRITLLPHYTEKQANDQGMTRQQARRYVDVKFLRRAEPIDDFSIALDPETLWWNRWNAPDNAADARRIHLDPVDVADLLRNTATGTWPSIRAAATDLGLSGEPASRLLKDAARAGLIEPFKGPRNSTGYRLPGGPE